MNVVTKSAFAALAVLGLGTVAHDASASAIDDPGSGYSTTVIITSPSPTFDSQFEFVPGHSIAVSSAGFSISADFNSDGTIAFFNSVSGLPNAVDTGAQILGLPVFATLEWQASGNSGSLHAFTAADGAVTLSLRFKINFTGPWLGGNTCRTAAFTVTMNNTGNSYPYPSLTGSNYSASTGEFGVVSNGFYVADVNHTSCAYWNDLLGQLDVGKTSGAARAGMKIDRGVAKYDYNGSFVSGS